MDIEITFINRSSDENNSNVVIFQQNTPTDYNEILVAWRVIQDCSQWDRYPFIYPYDWALRCVDDRGDTSALVAVLAGQQFTATADVTGALVLTHSGNADSPRDVVLRNALPHSAITAELYKDNRPIARRSNVAPQEMAVFPVDPTISISRCTGMEEGHELSPGSLLTAHADISLAGMISADIVMTGGGLDPIAFHLENVVMA